MSKRFIIGLVIALCFLSGCSRWKPVAYTPNILDADDLPQQLQRMIEEQGHAPLNLVVTDEKLSGDVISASQYAASASSYVVYYDRIETIEIFTAKGKYAVLMKGKGGKLLLRLVSQDPEEANHMADVVATLVQRAKSKQ